MILKLAAADKESPPIDTTVDDIEKSIADINRKIKKGGRPVDLKDYVGVLREKLEQIWEIVKNQD